MSASAGYLCTIALSDAKHDFGAAMVPIASKTIPPSRACQAIDEDKLLETKGIEKTDENKFTIIPSSALANTYTPFPDISAGSLIKQLNDTLGASVYFIVDTYHDTFRDELASLSSTQGTTYYWVQNRQTLYDPAGKTTEETSAGKVIFKNNPRVIFTWENIDPGMTKGECYPMWARKGDEDLSVQADFLERNELFYTSNTVFQVLEEDTRTKPSTQTVKCIMKTPRGIVVANKQMAQIHGANLAKGEYANLVQSAKKYITTLFSSSAAAASFPNFTDEHHCPLKRLGDQGQALSCTKSQMYLRLHSASGAVENHISNGNHAFVTIDRPALVASLTYQVPIAIYCYKDGGYALFIHNSILKPDTLYANLLKQYTALYSEYREIVDNLNASVQIIMNKRRALITELEEALMEADAQFEETNAYYRAMVKRLFAFVRTLDVLNANPVEPVPIRDRKEFQDSIAGGQLEELQSETSALQSALNQNRTATTTVNMIMTQLEKAGVVLDKCTIQNIDKAYVYEEGGRSSRIFVAKKEEFTVAMYLQTLYRALKAFANPELEARYTRLLERVLQGVDVRGTEYHAAMSSHIRDVLAKVGKIIGEENVTMLGGQSSAFFSTDSYLRCLFGLFCIMKDRGGNLMSDAGDDISSSMQVLYERIFSQEMGAGDDESEYVTPYYIDFFEAQLSEFPNLAAIYEGQRNTVDMTITQIEGVIVQYIQGLRDLIERPIVTKAAPVQSVYEKRRAELKQRPVVQRSIKNRNITMKKQQAKGNEAVAKRRVLFGGAGNTTRRRRRKGGRAGRRGSRGDGR